MKVYIKTKDGKESFINPRSIVIDGVSLDAWLNKLKELEASFKKHVKEQNERLEKLAKVVDLIWTKHQY